MPDLDSTWHGPAQVSGTRDPNHRLCSTKPSITVEVLSVASARLDYAKACAARQCADDGRCVAAVSGALSVLEWCGDLVDSFRPL